MILVRLPNFVVRPKRKLVEKYSATEAWQELEPDDITVLAAEVAGLPSELDPEDEEAKRFDLLMLNLQIAVLRHEPQFMRLRDQVQNIAGLLEEQSAIPMVKDEMELIEELQSEEWWQDVTIPMLESVRKRIRSLVRLIEKHKRKNIFTDFEDEVGQEVSVDLIGITVPDTFERFRAKARAFLRDHEDHIAVHRLRTNKPLTESDLDELEQMLIESGIGDAQLVEKATQDSQGLGLFVRSLVGLDRGAAKEAFAQFLNGRTMVANQIEFVNLIVDHMTEHGVMPAALLYESPFTDVTPHGPDGIFTAMEVGELVGILDGVRATAVA